MSILTEYGSEFQKKCLVALIKNKEFFHLVFDGLSPELFDMDADRWIMQITLSHFQQYKELPTSAVFGVEKAKIPDDDVLKTSVNRQLVDVFTLIQNPPTDLQYIQDKFVAFCKKQKITAAIIKAADLTQVEKHNESQVLLNDAFAWGIDRSLGHDYVEDFDKRIATDNRPIIETPWECINTVMNGGLRVGELGCVMAGSGFGKSWMLCAIGLAALKNGKRVIHYTFEMPETETALRYDSLLMGVAPNEVKNHAVMTKNAISQLTGKFTAKWFAPLTITANGIIGHLQSEISFGNKPDLIIIDYADKMNNSRPAQADWQRLAFVYEEIVSVLGQLGVAGWTASQVNRDGRKDDNAGLENIAGSLAKGDPAAFIMSVNRNIQDMLDGTAHVHVAKNRYGPTGDTFLAWMKTDRGRIEIHSDASMEGMKIRETMHQGQETAVKRKQIDWRQKLIDASHTP